MSARVEYSTSSNSVVPAPPPQYPTMDTRAPQHYDPRVAAVSRSYTYKKVTKPLLERRRRARMSKCLDELKALLVGPMRISEESLNRLEKADILEMAVQYLHNLESNIRPNRYQEGFNECAAEACHFLETSSECDESLSERLVEHLEECTGPLSIQVPSYRLTFSPARPASCSNSPPPGPSCHSVGLLMRATAENSRKRPAQLPFTANTNKPKKLKHHQDNSAAYTPSSMASSSSTFYFRCNTPDSADQENVWRPW